MSSNPIYDQLISGSIDILQNKSLPRIQKCLGELSDAEIWHRPNENLVSIGNLILHLCGNMRQWIITGIGGAPDIRERAKEFSEKGPLPRAELIQRLDATLREACDVIRNADPVKLAQPRVVQGETTTGVNVILHVTEHFSYHTGQISLHTKLMKNIDLGYFKDRDLNVRS
jgi:uncharacterized damage-inducible protein DinB